MERLAEQMDEAALVNYLRLAGWEAVRSDTRRSIWRHGTGGRVFVPAVRGPDTEELLQLAIRDIARAEARDEDELVEDLAWRQYDRLSLRRLSRSSSLSLSEAIDLHDALNDVVTAAALSASEARPVYVGRRPATVDNFMEQVRLVPPAIGSFVVRALLPLNLVPPAIGSSMFPLPDFPPPDSRHISRQISVSCAAAIQTAQDVAAGARLRRWDEAVDAGVSSNLCDALARLPGTQNSGDASIAELRVEWTWEAPAEPVDAIEVPPGLSSVLFAASDYLRGTPEEHSIRIVGRVIKLHREAATGPGAITVKGQVDNWDSSARSLRVPLDEVAYREAIQAHDNGETVAVVALVRREARRLTVARTEDLQVLHYGR